MMDDGGCDPPTTLWPHRMSWTPSATTSAGHSLTMDILLTFTIVLKCCKCMRVRLTALKTQQFKRNWTCRRNSKRDMRFWGWRMSSTGSACSFTSILPDAMATNEKDTSRMFPKFISTLSRCQILWNVQPLHSPLKLSTVQSSNQRGLTKTK